MNRTRAVLLDWRGTLVTTMSMDEWASAALTKLGRAAGTAEVGSLAHVLSAAALEGPDVDCDAALHRATYLTAFEACGFDVGLSETLYAIESDAAYNPFALDAPDTMRRLKAGGLRLAVVSDIHFDIRPAFAAAGLLDLVDHFALSFEVGAQKPDRRIFMDALKGIHAEPSEALMVGDRAAYDGAAVDLGIPTLLLPPLRHVRDCRLDRVLSAL